MAINKQLKTQVANILRIHPKTRNSDAALVMRLYNEYFYLPDPVSQLKLYEIMAYAKPDEIVRYRRRFNQEGLYLATDEKILKERNKRKKEMRENLGYSIHQDLAISSNEFDKNYQNTLKI